MQQASYHSFRQFWPLSLFPGFQICLALRHLNGLAGYELFNRIKPQHLIFWILPNHIRYAVKQVLVVDHKVWWIRSLKAWQLVTKAPATNLQRPRPLAAGQKKQNGESHCEGGGGASWMIHFPNFSCLGLFQKSFRKNRLILCPVSFFLWMKSGYGPYIWNYFLFTVFLYNQGLHSFSKYRNLPSNQKSSCQKWWNHQPSMRKQSNLHIPVDFAFVCLFVCLFVCFLFVF